MGNKKHILFISSWYPNKNNPTHGVFNQYFAQAVALNNKVSVLHVSSDSNQESALEFDLQNESGINTLRVFYKKVTTNLPFLSQLVKLMRIKKAFELGFKRLLETEGKPDLIHLNVAMPAGIGVLQLASKYGLPFVLNENWSGYCAEDGNYKGFFQTYFTRKIVSASGAVLPTSEFLKQAMLSHGLTGNYAIVPNVVDVNRFIPKPHQTDKITRFVHISSLTDREKNVSGILRAFTKALAINPNLRLSIVGDGEERPALQQLAAKLDPESRIEFKGRKMGNDLVNEINLADSLIMFSHFETFCLVIIEAFACGKPVLTSNAGAIKSYMKPELGIMVEKGNEAELAQAILNFDLTKNKFDRDDIRRFAVSNYSYENVSQQLDEIYNRVIKESKAKTN